MPDAEQNRLLLINSIREPSLQIAHRKTWGNILIAQ